MLLDYDRSTDHKLEAGEGKTMPYQVVELVDAVPKGRTRGPKVDKYAEFKTLLDEVPAGKVAQVNVPKEEYRKFSAGVRAAAIRIGRVASAKYKSKAAWLSWVPLTEENKPKRRGRPRPRAAATQ